MNRLGGFHERAGFQQLAALEPARTPMLPPLDVTNAKVRQRRSIEHGLRTAMDDVLMGMHYDAFDDDEGWTGIDCSADAAYEAVTRPIGDSHWMLLERIGIDNDVESSRGLRLNHVGQRTHVHQGNLTTRRIMQTEGNRFCFRTEDIATGGQGEIVMPNVHDWIQVSGVGREVHATTILTTERIERDDEDIPSVSLLSEQAKREILDIFKFYHGPIVY